MNLSTTVAPLNSILIFGAKDHIGSEVVRYIQRYAPNIKLRLATHDPSSIPMLRMLFPHTETVVANLLDKHSMIAATQGIEGIFQISPDVFDENTLVDNILEAAETHGNIRHIVRILGTPPGATLDMVPEALMQYPNYPASQHLISRKRYLEAGLPTTFVNVAGYFMDDFIRMFAPPIFQQKTIQIAYNKPLAWIAPKDVAQVCAEILISHEQHLIGTTVDITGSDLLDFREVAALMSEVFHTTIHYDDNEQRFFEAIKPVFTALWGEQAPAYFMKYFKWETEHADLFHINDSIEQILGRKPITFKQWLLENEHIFRTAWHREGVH